MNISVIIQLKNNTYNPDKHNSVFNKLYIIKKNGNLQFFAIEKKNNKN